MYKRQGLGRLLVDAVTQRDYPVIQGLVLLFSFEFILINLIVDCLLYTSGPVSFEALLHKFTGIPLV